MAYVSSQSSASRARTAIIVAALQAAGIYAIIASLSYVVGPRDPDKPITTTFTPVPPEKPTETAKPQDKTIYDPIPQPSPLPTPQVTPTSQPTGTSGPAEETGTGSGTGTASPSPLPTSEPSRAAFTPKSPKPKGRPGEWVSRNDYPAQDLREGNEGTVRFRLGVGADGKVTSCTVTGSSGFPRLDAAACAKLSQRGRFDPRTDENGAKVAGTWYSSVRWSIEK
ncbi:TonB family protein [Novosphingobium sp.]|uniref:energy transducer TonB n=1 Tax=Novosphingobium sp. TaxID=1874826 RepID=UPI00286E3D4A|nr:TonB family protein [Novosphingobium sp.]